MAACDYPSTFATPQQFLHSYQSPPPQTTLQSFAQKGYAPFGHMLGTTPAVVVPQPQIVGGAQPVYHLKVTATPIDVPADVVPPEGPEYTVTAYPTEKNKCDVASARQGEAVIGHIIPDLEAQNIRGLTIRPINLEAVAAQKKAVANSAQTSRSLSWKLPLEAVDTNERSNAFVQIYGGAAVADAKEILKHYKPLPTTAQFVGAPFGLEPGRGRSIPLTRDVGDLDDERKPKNYSWIIPTGGAEAEATAAALAQNGIDVHTHASEVPPPMEEDVEKFFALASAELRADGNGGQLTGIEETAEAAKKSTEPDTKILSTPTDDELGLPFELRPSVVYGGVEHAPPEFSGTKGKLKYKLHAIEVHQYVPIPDSKEPWIISSQINPSTTAIFGPMPMPFDPTHSGMVAPTFHHTIGLQPVPTLSPEIARMFNHELPIVSNLLDTLPPAETDIH